MERYVNAIKDRVDLTGRVNAIEIELTPRAHGRHVRHRGLRYKPTPPSLLISRDLVR